MVKLVVKKVKISNSSYKESKMSTLLSLDLLNSLDVSIPVSFSRRLYLRPGYRRLSRRRRIPYEKVFRT